MNPKSNVFLFAFILVSCLNIWAGHSNNESLVYFTKPLLIPLLAIWFFFETKNAIPVFRNMIFVALFFSWAGDTLLMFVPSKGEQFFLLGLVSFLTAHILYATAFFKNVNWGNGFLKKNWWAIIPFILIYLLINYFLIPTVSKAMQAPVMIYGGVIMLMAIAALNRKDAVAQNTFQLVFLGALIFMVSDIILAFNKFYAPIEYASFLIMSTYLLGQFCIVKGWTKNI